MRASIFAVAGLAALLAGCNTTSTGTTAAGIAGAAAGAFSPPVVATGLTLACKGADPVLTVAEKFIKNPTVASYFNVGEQYFRSFCSGAGVAVDPDAANKLNTAIAALLGTGVAPPAAVAAVTTP